MRKPRREDITGRKFGRLTAINFSHKDKNRKTYWDFECECGTIKTLRTDCVKGGKIQSCGCLKREQDKINLDQTGSHHYKYSHLGIGKVSECNLYSRWQHMKIRCYNPHFKQYKDYGGRGISMCEEWLYSFENFYNWSIENGFSEELEIDRIDNNGNYEPSNCRWVTHKVNANNTRRCKKYKYANTEVS